MFRPVMIYNRHALIFIYVTGDKGILIGGHTEDKVHGRYKTNTIAPNTHDC